MTIRVELMTHGQGVAAVAIDDTITVTGVTPVEAMDDLRKALARKYDRPFTLAVHRA